MRKSIFLKFFSLTAGIILLSFIVFGFVQVSFTQGLWEKEKNNLLANNVKQVAEYSDKMISELDNHDYFTRLQNIVDVTANMMNADIYIVRKDGNTIMCNHGENECVHKEEVVPQHNMLRALSGANSEKGRLGEIYQCVCYTVSHPIYYNGEPVAAVFASVRASDLQTYIVQIMHFFVLCTMIVIIFIFMAVYLVTAKLTKPLRQMANAAHRMENGDFLARIPTNRRDEVGQLAEGFNKMAASLSSLEQMRRSFISSVSHELKTPMTTISGFIDGILDGTIKEEDKEQYLKIVSEETKRLSRLVNSMLQLSKLDKDGVELNYSSFNFTDIVARTLLSFEKRIEEKNINIRGLEESPAFKLSADKDMIYQVVYNLIENAIKFTPENGYIEIHLTGAGNSIKFTVENSGEGLSKRELVHVFERFYKSDRSRSEDKSGIGFGLYIVKTIVKLHGGSIKASSSQGKYTKFEVTLPNVNWNTN